MGWLIFLGAYIAGYFYMYFRNISGPQCKGVIFCLDLLTPLASFVVYELFLFLWLALLPILSLIWMSIKRKYASHSWIGSIDWVFMIIGVLWIVDIMRIKGIF